MFIPKKSMKEMFREEPNVRNVNNLVSKAFGPFVRGNWEFFDGGNYGSPVLNKTKKLGQIGRRIPLGLIFPLALPMVPFDEVLGIIAGGYLFSPLHEMGRFTSKDGSSLEVWPKYMKRANKYAELYKNQFGTDVKICVMKDNYQRWLEEEQSLSNIR